MEVTQIFGMQGKIKLVDSGNMNYGHRKKIVYKEKNKKGIKNKKIIQGVNGYRQGADRLERRKEKKR